MIRIAAMVGLVAAPSTFAVGYWQGEHNEPAAAVSTVQINAPVIAKPGAGAANAAEYLAGLNAPPPPPPPPAAGPAVVRSSTPIQVGPPPVDIGVQFRNEVTAIRTGSQPHIVLAGGRTIAQGQAYRDGWSVRSLTPQTAVLGKGRETRAVNLFSAPPREPTMQIASLAAPVFTGPVGLTNGVTAEQRTADLARRLAQMTPEQRRAFMQSPAGRAATTGLAAAGLNADGRGGRGGQGQQFGQGRQQGQGDGGGRNRGGFGGGQNQGPNGGFGGRNNITITPPPPPPPTVQAR